MKKIYCIICDNCRKLKDHKTSNIFEKALVFLLFTVSAKINITKYLKMRYLKILALIENI